MIIKKNNNNKKEEVEFIGIFYLLRVCVYVCVLFIIKKKNKNKKVVLIINIRERNTHSTYILDFHNVCFCV